MFSAHELIDIAIKLEKNGEDFYREAREKVSSSALESLLHFLADEESRHGEWFEQLKGDANLSHLASNGLELDSALLQDLVGDQQFSLGDVDLSKVDNIRVMIDHAIEFEKDTILFYEMLRSVIDTPEILSILDKIIGEEKRHIENLEDYQSG